SGCNDRRAHGASSAEALRDVSASAHVGENGELSLAFPTSTRLPEEGTGRTPTVAVAHLFCAPDGALGGIKRERRIRGKV
ncbi:MAG: hypothetical protein JWP87_2458, partial [Labilithrix sp.]|nr:hypothetical protein [Labilithrix sp.]